jgi:predicted AlkP superfamily pyrophosphatase or phosphodiesterase
VRVTPRLALVLALAACNSAASRPQVVDPPAAATPTAAAQAAAAPGGKSKLRVLIISEDGMRPDALDATTAPTHMALNREGMIARRAWTVNPSETLPSHASMLSGFAVADHKMNFDRFDKHRGQIELPTIFQIAREHGLSTAMFVGKQKLWHIAPTASVDHYEKPGFLCHVVAARAAAYYEAQLPDLMFVHFADPDNAGHAQGWMSPPYIAAVSESDRCLRTMLDALDHSGTAATTVLIVTADHGGSGRSHSGHGKELDRRIPWTMRGPLIRPGSMVDADVMTEDTAVTALAALKLPTQTGMVGVSWYPPPTNLVHDAPTAAK